MQVIHFFSDIKSQDIEESVYSEYEDMNTLSLDSPESDTLHIAPNSDSSSDSYNTERTYHHEHYKDFAHNHSRHNGDISFTGYGKCVCGCGSFVGSGNYCQACKHEWSAHSR